MQCAGDDKSRSQCFSDLQQIAGDAANRLSMDAKTGVVSFDTSGLDLSKNGGGALVNDLVGSKNIYDFSVDPTVMTDKGPVRIDKIGLEIANLPTFGDQPKSGNPPAGVSDILGLYLNNPNISRVSNNLKVAPEKEISVSSALIGHVFVRGTDEPANGVTVELCSADWNTVFKSTKPASRRSLATYLGMNSSPVAQYAVTAHSSSLQSSQSPQPITRCQIEFSLSAAEGTQQGRF